MATSNIKVVTQFDPDLPQTVVDPGQLQQAFLNIILNAATEMKLAHKEGELLVKTERIDDTIRISFKDNGPGIAEENLERIFEPFFTTRKPGAGTGLGLSVCHGIVAEHNGQIYARNNPDKGAIFVIELPVTTELEQPEPASPAGDESGKTTGARILVVDDEPATLQLLSQVLSAEGYEVQTVDNADDAVGMMKTEGYDLILLDIKMPGMSGIELYRDIQEAASPLIKRVVFITGDSMGSDTRNFLIKSKASCIIKPFNIVQLKRDISHLLTRRA
jgi:CheY-like chemotaxis protein